MTLTQSATPIIIQFIFFFFQTLHLRLFFTLGELFINFSPNVFRNYALITSPIFWLIYRPTFRSPSLIKHIHILEFYQIFFCKENNNENDSYYYNRSSFVIEYTVFVCTRKVFVFIIAFKR